jgi:hypothetical protein
MVASGKMADGVCHLDLRSTVLGNWVRGGVYGASWRLYLHLVEIGISSKFAYYTLVLTYFFYTQTELRLT